MNVLIFFLALIGLLVRYILRDPKGLNRFPNATSLSHLTDVALILQRRRGLFSEQLRALHKKHPILRVAPDSLSLDLPSAEAIRKIYGHNTPCIKGGLYETISGPHKSLLDETNKALHSQKRRVLSHAFATRNLEMWEHKVMDKVDRLIRQFDTICDNAAEKWPVMLDFTKWANLFTIEAIADIALSQHLGCIERGDDNVEIESSAGGKREVRYIDSLHADRRASSTFVWSATYFRLIKIILQSLPGYYGMQWRKGVGFVDMLRYFTKRRIQRFKDGEKLDDLVACLLHDKKNVPRNLELGEVEAEVSLFLDAGSDTTGIALAHAMYCLVKSPKTLEKLRQELDTSLASSEGSYAAVKTLPYLRACLDESLRLFPPVAFGLNRRTPPEGLNIDGIHIPGDILVSVPTYSAHRNPVYFADPEMYRPERWLEPEGAKAQASFIPFSTGARGCIGRNISYIEQTILMARLLTRYDFEFVNEDFELQHEEGFNLWPGPLPLIISRREGKSLTSEVIASPVVEGK